MDLLSKPDYEGARLMPSPNFNMRAASVTMLVLHYTGMESEAAALARLQDEAAQVSAHYVVTEAGEIIQMVAEAARAWHAGRSFWHGESDINSCSIGVEIVNAGPMASFPDYPAPQIGAVIRLCESICARYKIKPRYVLAHSDIAPERKIDPGEKFPWGGLARAGIGHYVEPAPIVVGDSLALGMRGQQVAAYQKMLADYGYGLEVCGLFDELTYFVTAAFQRHFRPLRVDGIADISTRQTLQLLLESLN